MSITVRDGTLIEIDTEDERVLTWDWDSENLASGVVITSSSFALSAVKPYGIAVTIARSGSTATGTSTEAHGYVTGDWVTIEGADQADYNITVQVTVVDTLTFTFAVANTPTTPATGTITAAFGLGFDNPSILSAAPYNSRQTQVRVLGSGARALGRLFTVENTIVTNETPTQTKRREVTVILADL